MLLVGCWLRLLFIRLACLFIRFMVRNIRRYLEWVLCLFLLDRRRLRRRLLNLLLLRVNLVFILMR